MNDRVEILAARIRTTTRLTVLTGAGVSAASGVPTFRGQHGLWREYRPEELATAEAFSRNPTLVWEWYAWRRHTIAACLPNAAHEVLARWSLRSGCRIVTQNVDDLHLRAGTENLIRLHGSIWELTCWMRCPEGLTAWRDDRESFSSTPTCPYCGGLARPAVVWFGESLRPADLDAAVAAASCDVFLTVGTSAIVYPAAGLVHEARRNGAFTAEVNLESTEASDSVHIAVQDRAEVVLPLIDARIAALSHN